MSKGKTDWDFGELFRRRLPSPVGAGGQPRGFPGVRLSFEEAEDSLEAVADRLAMPRGWAAGTSSMFWRSPAEPRAAPTAQGRLWGWERPGDALDLISSRG